MEVFIGSMLERLLMSSAQAALLAAAVWLLCRYVPRLSPATQCWLWWLVALQVLLGLCVDPVRLPWLPQAPASVAVPPTGLNVLPDDAMAMSAARHGLPSWQTVVLLLWLSGFVVMCLATLRGWLRTRQLLRDSAPCMDERARAFVEAVAAHGLRAAPCLRVCRNIDSPLVIGHLHPVLLLPEEASLSTTDLEMAVAHELQHLRRADLWWGLVPALARHCFFFHPVMHLAVREYGIAREAACDAAVVEQGQRSRQEYGELLIRLGTAGSSSGLAAASSTFRALSRRLVLLQNTSFLPRTGAIAVLALAIAGVLPLRLVAAAAKPALVPVVVTAVKATPPVADSAGDAHLAAAGKNPPAARPAARAIRVAAAPAPTDNTAQQEQLRDQPETYRAGASSQRSPVKVPVKVLFRPDVRDFYPSASQALREEGSVKIRACVDERGRVTESTLAESSGFPRLDEAAVRMTKLYRFSPAMVDGISQSQCLVLPVQFRLTDEAPVYTGERMSANFQDIPTAALLQLISGVSGRTIVVDGSVSGSVTITLQDVSWDHVLDIVLRTKGLQKRVQNNEIVVATPQAFAAMDAAANSAAR